MGNIVLLDDLTINKIAAGEVIERPASVIKELVENSIDAGATNINVEIKNGGISYIRVTDNGKGIMPDDMEIAFERHATSKIRVAEDLETVKSMGFRGEALASIAAIAKVDMKSKTIDQDTGYQVIVEGGKIVKNEEIGCPNGTVIEIENLFYNTPVRYKFLKKDFTEAGYIEDVVTRIALIHPEIAIKLISSGKTIIQTPGNGDIKGVIYNIYGKEIAENIISVNYEYEDIKITGVIGKPVISRSNRANQLFFVNKRYVKDKTLSSSAEQGFKGMITIGKFGFLILNLEMNPQKVDVNVHPAKLEVRFEEEQKVFKAVYHSIKDTLLKNDLVANTEQTKEIDEEEQTTIKQLTFEPEKIEEEHKGLFQKILHKKEEPIPTTMIEELYQTRKLNVQAQNEETNFDSIMEKMAEMKNSVDAYKGIVKTEKVESEINNDIKEKIKYNDNQDTIVVNIQNLEENQETKVITEEMKQQIAQPIENEDTQAINTNEVIEKNESTVKEKFETMYTSIFGKSPVIENKVEEDEEQYKAPEVETSTCGNISIFNNEDDEITIPNYKFIGIAFSTYIIIELDKELYIIDQHAAHERIMYEKVKKNYFSDGNKDSQIMLLPDIITLTHKEMDIAKENIEMFEKAGFVLEEFGENTIKLIGVPNICLDLDTKELFLETLDEINTVARTAKQEIEEKFIATVACKAAVKANMALSKKEVDSLMEKLLKLPNPFTCPHGRPTAIKMTKTDIEKKFSRR
ncbi:MAG: DNA mismatch repair endonuclease MutL [Clostridiaceae bacterium]|nr:DNA mismatch repair endonuclease MutL [Clostridiaceae bacterium]